MAITYPLNTPTNLGIANITLSAENAVAISQSPFTFQQQVVAHPGQRWAASVSLPPMKRQDAEYWIAFLLSLKGQIGTFLLGDPNCVAPQGSVTALRNLASYTEQFDNAYWTKGNSTITADSVVAPNGTTTADTLVENTATNTHRFIRAFNFVAGDTYTLSVYVKEQSARDFALILPSTQFGGLTGVGVFDTTTGDVLSATGGVVAASESVGNGWFRVSITKAATVSSSGSYELRLSNGLNTSYLGDGVSGAYVWGAQLEVGSSTTAYQGVVASYGPSVNGGSQTGDTLVIDGCSPNVNGFLLPGDYIQIGSASATQLYKVLTSVDTDNSGGATVDIWPNLRSSPADDTAIITDNTKGRFRLRENVQQWQINEISSYGITFDCVEAI